MNPDLFSYTTAPGAQLGGTVRPTPVEPAATSPASAKGPHTCGSGEVHGRCEPTSPTYPDAPGFKERSGTSQAAAEAMAPRAGTLRAMALSALRKVPEGLTADEIADVCGVDRLAMRPRVSELGLAGLVEKTGRTRANASGKAAAVWRAR